MGIHRRAPFATLMAFVLVVGARSRAEAQTTVLYPTSPRGLGVYLRFSMGNEWMSLADHTFSGTGIARSDHSVIANYDARGRDVGMKFPAFAVFEVAAGVTWQWFTAGAFFDYGVAGAYNLSTPESPALASQVDVTSASLVLGGLEVGAMLTLRPWVFHLMLQGGYRSLGVPVTAYETTTCTSSSSLRTGMGGGTTPCPVTADGGSWFLRPRLQVDLAMGEQPHFSVGAYVMGEVYPDPGIAVGAVVGVRLTDLFPSTR